MNYIGKAMLAGSLCLQAYVLLTDSKSSEEFKSNANGIIKGCPHMSFLQSIYLHYATIVLLFASVLMVFMKCSVIKLIPLAGVILQTYITYGPINKIPEFTNVGFWQNVAIMGGLIFMMGVQCSPCCKKDEKKMQASKGSQKPKRQ